MALPGEVDFEGDLLAVKGGRGGRTGGGTGIGSGGGFGGGFGGGGSGFFGSERGSTSSFPFGYGPMMQKRRQFMGANGAVPISYSPTKPDTVPAMLSPGEFVVNNRSMQIPGVPDMLHQINAMGNGGQAGGPRFDTTGMRPGTMQQMFAEGGPVVDPDLLQQVMQILMQMGLLDGEGAGDMPQGGEKPEGGQVQHFAWGGMVKPQAGGFGRMGGMGAQGPANASGPRFGPQAGLNTNPTMGAYGGRSSGGSTQPRPILAPVGQPIQMGGQAGQYGGGFGGVNDTTGGNAGIQSMYDLINRYAAGGAFDPSGNPALMAAVQGQATSNADAMRARTANQLQLGGMDPGQAGAYKLQSDLRGQGDVANALNAAQYGVLNAQDQFGKNLFGNMNSFNQDAWKAWNDYVHQSRLGG